MSTKKSKGLFLFISFVAALWGVFGATDDARAQSASLTIRYQEQVVFDELVELATTTYHDDINGVDYELNTPTVFALLVQADEQSDAFNITDAQYNDAFQSFYVACITIAAGGTDACFNWQYVVNG